jgi:hypothetical protein
MRIRKASGKSWSRLKNEDFVTTKFLNACGRILVKSIVAEAKKDLAKQGGRPTGADQPIGVPADEAFFESFGYTLSGKDTIEIWSTWPFIDQILEGKPAYRMDWLRQESGVSKVPFPQPGGTVIIKSTPGPGQSSWVHPGFAKHDFLERGFKRASDEMEELLLDQITQVLSSTPPR